MKGIVRLLVLACGVAATTLPSVGALPALSTCRYSCVTPGPPRQIVSYSFSSTYAQCCDADPATLCNPGQNAIGLSWGNPAAKCYS